MYFETDFLYHIFNQGNNRQNIFFHRSNYYYFLDKIESFILPYADILAYCLMPNHFHFMVHINHTSLKRAGKYASMINGTESQSTIKTRSFNDSIGILLRSYTRAVNIQQNRTGTLFREETKAFCLNKIDKLTALWYTSNGITSLNTLPDEKNYPNICFNYIAYNPIKKGLVKNLMDWEFSSFSRENSPIKTRLINYKKIAEYRLKLLEETD
jgi:putative transposase